jgi:Tfp pilus assembly protein PilE
MRFINIVFKKNGSGFAMLEILIAVLIISSSMVGTLALNNYLLRTSANFKQHVDALNIAQSQIERFHAYGNLSDYNALLGGCPIVPTPVDCPLTSILSNRGSNTQYTCQFSVNPLSNSAACSLQITVSWSDVSGNSDSMSLTTIINYFDPNTSGMTIGT